MGRKFRCGASVLFVAGLLIGPLSGSAAAATCNVPSGSYATIQSAINDVSCDPIVVAAGTYNESLSVSRSVAIQGAGAAQTTVIGSTGSSTFGANAGTISASGLTLTHNPSGFTNTGASVQTGVTFNLSDSIVRDNVGSIGGGGIAVSHGTLNLTRSTVVNNTDTGAFLAGAGVSGSSAALNISDSTISGNHATGTTGGQGGGVAVTGGPSTVSITNSTITGNTTKTDGGGLEYADGTSVDLTNVTIAGNTADSDGDGTGNGGGIFIDTAQPIRLRNTIVANNTDVGGQAPDCGTFLVSYSLTRLGYVLLRDQTGCHLGGTGDVTTGYQTGVDPLLGPLAPNGGPTQTMALQSGSPALDAIPVASCAVTNDQRGVGRPQGSGCDIGAFELQPAPPPTTPDTTPPQTKIGNTKINHKKRSVKFKFSSNEAGSTFLCKLDKKPFKSCSSPKKYKHLKPGKHVFKVKAKDAAGNVDATPAKKKFKI